MIPQQYPDAGFTVRPLQPPPLVFFSLRRSWYAVQMTNVVRCRSVTAKCGSHKCNRPTTVIEIFSYRHVLQLYGTCAKPCNIKLQLYKLAENLYCIARVCIIAIQLQYEKNYRMTVALRLYRICANPVRLSTTKL